MSEPDDYQINVQHDKHGHKNHHKQASQTIFKNEHRNINACRPAKKRKIKGKNRETLCKIEKMC